MKIKSILPWWSKIAAKVVLARLPLGYRFWQKIGLFRHGHMDQSEYAIGVINNHLRRAGLDHNLTDRVVLELGPGDTISNALVTSVYGGEAILLDAGDFAEKNLTPYHALADHLAAQGFNVPDLTQARSLDDVVKICNANYLTDGLHSLKTVKENSVDLIFSQAVLEHVRKHDLLETMRECRRVIKSTGVASHRIDLKDHLGGGLNNLRFSERLWESNFFVNSGFYTNRIRYSEILLMMQAAGFDIEVVNVDRWRRLPIEKQQMHPVFAKFSDDDLLISGFDVLLRPI